MKQLVGVIGAADASVEQIKIAEEVGKLIAKNGWVLINGGLEGVMEASAKGANQAGGIVVGILPTPQTNSANPYVTIPIATNLGHARNVIIAHTADALIAIGGKEGTLSEIAIARKLGKPVFGINSWEVAGVKSVASAQEAIQQCEQIFSL
ncbi:MAG: TIGR00725 family protein [Pseudomonadota bacterium]